MSDWFNEHEGWADQFTEFLESVRNDADVTDEDRMFVSNVAAKVKRGEMSMHRAVHEVLNYVAAQMGYIAYPDEEAFRLDMQYHDRLEVTEELKANLLMVDEPGIADAIVHAFASMRILDDHSDHDECMVGMHTKAWFQANRMSPEEDQHFKWAVGEALRQRYQSRS